MAYSFDRLQVEADGRIVFVTISNPPVNVITGELFAELNAFSKELKADSDRTVAVFKSADPDFFLAHFDVSAILEKSRASAFGVRTIIHEIIQSPLFLRK